MQLDIREAIRLGRSPCSIITDAAAQLSEGETLELTAPFEPSPLYEVLGREGFTHESKDLGGGDWEVRFTKNPKAAVQQLPTESGAEEHAGCGCGCPSQEVIEVDVRGLEPPQPMVRILEVLATLPEGATLRALTDRQPLHLFDQLEARGFSGESEESTTGGYVTVICRN